SFVSFPIFLGISAIAPQIVEIFLGARWTSAVLPLRLLAASMVLNPVGAILPTFLMGIGQFRASLRNTIFGIVFFPLAYAIGSRWGTEGVCIAAAVAYPTQFLVLVSRCAIITQCQIWTFLQPLARPFIGSIIMFLCVLFAQHLLRLEPVELA